MVTLKRDEQVSTRLSGYGGGVIRPDDTKISFSFVQWDGTQRLHINNRIDYFVNKQRPKFNVRVSWSSSDVGDETNIRNLPIKNPGVYLVTVNLIITTTKGFEVRLTNTNGQVDCIVKHVFEDSSTKETKIVTATLACAVVVRQKNSVVKVDLVGDTKTSLGAGSTASVTFITANHMEHPVLKLKMGKLIRYHAWGSRAQKQIHGFSIQAMSKIFMENQETAVPIHTGTYLVSCQLIISVTKPRYIQVCSLSVYPE